MNIKQQKGFTIIEVVLVLAIAGLIFLMVFVALPALQSGQRDTARRSDVGIVASAVNTYVSNNRGTWPNSTQLQSYVTNVSGNTDVSAIEVVDIADGTEIDTTDSVITVVTGAKCVSSADDADGTAYTVEAGTARQYSTITYVEAGNGSSFCQDS